MYRYFIVLLLTVTSFAQTHQCGKERWDVKTLQDGFTLPEAPMFQTVDVLRNLPKPKVLPKTRLQQETTLYQVPARLLGFKLEDDKDLHLVISELLSSNKTMIAEIPSPNCASDILRQQLIDARASLLAITGHKLPKSVGQMYWLPKSQLVSVTGVLFFDKIHGQTGVAPNGVELHPVVKIAIIK